MDIKEEIKESLSIFEQIVEKFLVQQIFELFKFQKIDKSAENIKIKGGNQDEIEHI